MEVADEKPADPLLAEQTMMLLGRAKAGDRDAAGQLVDRYRNRMRAFLRVQAAARGFPASLADDVAQEVFLRALKALDRFEYRGLGSFWCYLRAIALNLVIKTVTDPYAVRGRGLSDESALEPAGASSSANTKVVRKELLEAFERGLDRLDERTRHAVVLRLEVGVDYAAIAKECGFSTADAARMAVNRALKEIATVVGDR